MAAGVLASGSFNTQSGYSTSTTPGGIVAEGSTLILTTKLNDFSGGTVFGSNDVYNNGTTLSLSSGMLASGNFNTQSGYSVNTTTDALFSGNFRLPYGFTGNCATVMSGSNLTNTSTFASLTGGVVLAANTLKSQMPYTLYSPESLLFDLTDASIIFQLERQP